MHAIILMEERGLLLEDVRTALANGDDDEIIVETAYRPDPALWEPDYKTRRKTR